MFRSAPIVSLTVALVLSFFSVLGAQASTTVPAPYVPGLFTSPAITLVVGAPNTVLLIADASAGDVTLVASNATITLSCGGSGCASATGQGTSSATLPASGSDLSAVTVTLTPTGSGTPGLTAKQGGATASVSVGSSSSGSLDVFTWPPQLGTRSGLPGSSATPTMSSPPPSSVLPKGGLGLFVFNGGTFADLVGSLGCPADRLAVWTTDSAGDFLVFIPGAFELVNSAFRAFFGDGLIPASTPMVGRCG